MKHHIKFQLGLIVASGFLAIGASTAKAQSSYPYPYAMNIFAGVTRSPGNADGTPGQFEFPFGVAVDSAGNVYVGDTNNDTIRKITPAGAVSTLAGLSTVAGSTDGTGSGARFYNPEGVAVDSAGNVYVADISNSTIRVITPAGVVSTLAGLAGTSGTSDGTGNGARFNGPAGVAVDSAGNVYVADTYSDTIRKITSAGVVTTFAGLAGSSGSIDGTGNSARFNQPAGVAVDASGDVYVADTYNDTIRKITPAGVVTTIAGLVGTSGSTDGTAGAARFYLPIGVAVDNGGNLYVADTYNDAIRSITPAGVVTTLAGQAGTSGATNGSGINAQFYLPYGVAVDSSGNIYVADTLNIIVRKGESATVPVIGTQPQNQAVNAGTTATLSVAASAANTLSYQWYLNGTIVAGATGATLTLPNAGTSQAGDYTVAVSAGASTVNSTAADLTVNYSARLTNMSARVDVGTGNNILIGGLGISGTGSKQVLLRGDGPQLAYAPFSLTGTLAHPQLTLFDNGQQTGESGSEIIAADIGWGNSPTTGPSPIQVSPQTASTTLMNSLGAFTLNGGSADCAMLITTPVGNNTFEIAGVNGTTGIALAEIYDADTGTPAARLTNISARAFVGVGGNILIGGFGITGTTSETVLIRASGPRLVSSPFNINDALAAPQLTLFDNGQQTGESGSEVIASNAGWNNSSVLGASPVLAGIQPATTAAFNLVGAFTLTASSADCAMIATLPPGNYTVEVSGAGNTTGVSLFEVYEVP